MAKSKSELKREAALAADQENEELRENDAPVEETGPMTTSTSIEEEPTDENADEVKSSKKSTAKDAEEDLVDVTFVSNINTRFGGKDYVGREFRLPAEEAEALKNHVRELHGPSMIQ